MTAFGTASLPVAPRTTIATTKITYANPYRDNAFKVLPVTVTNGKLRNEQIINVVTTLCPMFRGSHECEVQPLNGGLSNELFIVSNNAVAVLVRLHPTVKTEIVNREEENRVMAWLSREGIAPTYFGRFQNGRVEEFYKGYQPLSFREMPTFGPNIATLMARMHQLQVPQGILSEPDAIQVWHRIQTWLNLAKDLSGASCELDLTMLGLQADWLHKELTKQSTNPATLFCQQVVFTHMDCQSLNVLKNANEDLKLIDFEYSGMNPRAVDIANTFCEYCDMNNLQANYALQYPSLGQQKDFLRAYLKEVQHAHDDTFMRDLCLEVGKYTLVSHLQWTLWSIVQSHLSAVEFDYMAYARHRLDGYNYFKHKYFES